MCMQYSVHTMAKHTSLSALTTLTIPYSGKLLREKTFANFEVREPSAKIFSTKILGMSHPLMFGFKQSVKVFSVKFSLPTDSRKFSSSKVCHYTV